MEGTRIAVIGAGSWGTALMKLLSANAEQPRHRCRNNL